MAPESSEPRAIKVSEIEKLMDEQNLSKSELARRTKMSLKQIRNILDKKSVPREETITRIAAVLGVKWRTLLEEYEGTSEGTNEGGGVAIKTTVDLIFHMADGMNPEEAKTSLLKGLTARHIQASDVIRITIIRDDNEN